MRVGAPVPLPIFIGMQKIVAPDSGSLSAFATFSKPGLFAPSHSRCTGKSFELPGSMLAVSIAIAATLRFLDVTTLEENLDVLRPYIFREI